MVLRDNVNEQNAIVKLVTDVADAISGPFSRNDGIFDFSGKNAVAKNALVNWGIAAIVYLRASGGVLADAIAPKGKRLSRSSRAAVTDPTRASSAGLATRWVTLEVTRPTSGGAPTGRLPP